MQGQWQETSAKWGISRAARRGGQLHPPTPIPCSTPSAAQLSNDNNNLPMHSSAGRQMLPVRAVVRRLFRDLVYSLDLLVVSLWACQLPRFLSVSKDPLVRAVKQCGSDFQALRLHLYQLFVSLHRVSALSVGAAYHVRLRTGELEFKLSTRVVWLTHGDNRGKPPEPCLKARLKLATMRETSPGPTCGTKPNAWGLPGGVKLQEGVVRC